MAMRKADFSFIRYSNCWEDTHILRRALSIKRGETGISVASAGDNTFALLLDDPKRIYAFDLNPTQLYCCELKMACFRCLSYEEMLTLLGVLEGCRRTLYEKLRHGLSEDAVRYFDAHPEIIDAGIIHVGKFERYFGIFRRFVIPLVAGSEAFGHFARANTLSAQWNFYRRYIDTGRFRAMFRLYFGYRVMGQLGRDSSFYDHVKEKEQSGSDIRSRFEYGIRNTVNAENPYINYIITGNYTRRSLPLYLRRENFAAIRSRIDRITLIKGDLLSLQLQNVDFANLSDIFEYMSESDAQRNMQHLAEMLCNGARAACWNMQNRRYLDGADFVRDAALSEALFRRNHSWFYRDFMLYRRGDFHE